MRALGWTLLLAASLAACDDPARPRVPASVQVAGGDQTASVGTALPAPLVAQVTEADGDPVRGVVVRWTVSAGDVEPDSSVTDIRGEARTVWTLGTVAGPQTATASVEGVPSATVSATSVAGPAARVAALPDSLTFSLAGDTALLRVTVADRFGNAVPGVAFTSLDPAAATVDDAGVVRAVATGRARIVASAGAAADTIPVRVRIARYVEVSAGITHTCAVTAEGEGFCWGGAAFGVLGNGDTADRFAPTRVAGSTRWSTISAGFQHTCGLSTDGEAFCWGYNDLGQLGIGEPGGSRNEPTPAATGVRFTRLSTGGKHTCARAATGRMLCWGAGGSGQLGTGSLTDLAAPTPVADTIRYAEVSAGSEHSCGVTAGGTAYCWGSNVYGQLGDRTRQQRTRATLLAEQTGFTSITAGSQHTCGLVSGTRPFCWGRNDEGQLGSGGTQDVDVPTPVAGSRSLASLDAGAEHTCGVETAGGGLCWGRGVDGQLGNGSTQSVRAPTPLAGPAPFQLISAGGRHSCGLAQTGALRCWGVNSSGQLGTGTDAPSAVPVRVAAPR